MQMVHRAGDLAYFDSTLAGLVPLKVLKVNRNAETSKIPSIIARVTAKRGIYPRGMVFESILLSYVIPRDHVRYRGDIPIINNNYTWID